MSRAATRAYEQIRADIVSGAREVGARLKEEDLAGEIGVSRTPVREALRRLGTEGLVDFRPNQGAYVATWSLRDLEEVFDLRETLESHGARLAAVRARADDIAALARIHEAMEHAGCSPDPEALDRIAHLNSRFHNRVHRAAGHRRLAQLLSNIIDVPVLLWTARVLTPEDMERAFGHHGELIAALRAADADWAGAVMTCHIRAMRQIYLKDPMHAAHPV